MSYTLDLLKQLAGGLARQSGPDCKIVVHDLEKHNLEHSAVHINNGHVANRREGDSPSKVVLETLHKGPAILKNHPEYLARTSNGKILKSSTSYIRNEEGTSTDYLPSINCDMTELMAVDCFIKTLIDTEPQTDVEQQPEQIIHNVNDLSDTPIEQSVALIEKPAALINKEEKTAAIQFLNDAGASLIIKSEDKVSKYFRVSKLALYSYIDINSHGSDDKNDWPNDGNT